MLTTASPLRFVIRTDAIIAQPGRVVLPARTLPRTRLTLTDRPTMARCVPTAQSRRFERARQALQSAPLTAAPVVADCTAELTTERRSAAWHALASFALVLVVVALCAACALHGGRP